MRNSFRLYSLAAIVTILLLLVAACGGGKEPTAAPSPTATPAPQQPTATTAPPTRPPAATATSIPTPTPQPTPTPIPAETRPQRGGVLAIRLQSDITQGNGWDSHWTGGYIQIKTNPTMLNGSLMLDELDPSQFKGDLAESWTVSDDGLLYSLKYRSGIKFHDGTPFKATDVIFSYNRISGVINTGYISHQKGTIADYVASMEAPDDVTLRIRLKNPSAAFINSLASLFSTVYPERLGSDYPKDPHKPPVGTGAFKFVDRKPDISITVRRNEGYFKKDRFGDPLPYLDGIDFSIIPDSFTAFSVFRTGKFLEADYLDPGILNTNIDQTKKEFPNYTYGTGFGSWRMYNFNNKPPFDDVRIRRAIDLLVDRPGFMVARYPGYGHAGASPLLPPSIQGRWGLTDQETSQLINTGPVTPERIAQARALFREAGVNYDTFTFKLMSLPIQTYLDDGVFLQDSWKKAGLKVELDVTTLQEFTPRRTKAQFDLFYIPASSIADDPDFVLGRYYITGGSENFGKFSDPKVDKLYRDQSATVDFAKRKAITQDLQRYILTDANWYPKVGWAGAWTAWSPRIRNYTALCPGAYCFRARHEITWLAPETPR